MKGRGRPDARDGTRRAARPSARRAGGRGSRRRKPAARRAQDPAPASGAMRVPEPCTASRIALRFELVERRENRIAADAELCRPGPAGRHPRAAPAAGPPSTALLICAVICTCSGSGRCRARDREIPERASSNWPSQIVANWLFSFRASLAQFMANSAKSILEISPWTVLPSVQLNKVRRAGSRPITTTGGDLCRAGGGARRPCRLHRSRPAGGDADDLRRGGTASISTAPRPRASPRPWAPGVPVCVTVTLDRRHRRRRARPSTAR